MALELEHFRSIPSELGSLGQGLTDSVSVLVGCVTTAAAQLDRLEDETTMDLLVRASHRADEVILITGWILEKHEVVDRTGSHAALRDIKMILGVMLGDWSVLARDQRRRLLLVASDFLARFCQLFRIERTGLVGGLS